MTLPNIHLQAFGLHAAKPWGEFAPGDLAVFNYGTAREVLAISRVTKTTVEVTLGPCEFGGVVTVKRRALTLAGWRSGTKK
jgi:hypothetical protein